MRLRSSKKVNFEQGVAWNFMAPTRWLKVVPKGIFGENKGEKIYINVDTTTTK